MTITNLGSYEYNGLHWRTAKNTKVPVTEEEGGYSGERRVYTYDAAWHRRQDIHASVSFDDRERAGRALTHGSGARSCPRESSSCPFGGLLVAPSTSGR